MAEPKAPACTKPKAATVMHRSMELPDGFKRPDLGAIVRGGGDVQAAILKAYQSAGARIIAKPNQPKTTVP